MSSRSAGFLLPLVPPATNQAQGASGGPCACRRGTQLSSPLMRLCFRGIGAAWGEGTQLLPWKEFLP